jgi:hypothetical protein
LTDGGQRKCRARPRHNRIRAFAWTSKRMATAALRHRDQRRAIPQRDVYLRSHRTPQRHPRTSTSARRGITVRCTTSPDHIWSVISTRNRGSFMLTSSPTAS